MKELDEAASLDQPKVVKLGDASIASPFTSRHSSIECGECENLYIYSVHIVMLCGHQLILFSSLSCDPTRSLYVSDHSTDVQDPCNQCSNYCLLSKCFVFGGH